MIMINSPHSCFCLLSDSCWKNMICPIWDNRASVTWKWQQAILQHILTATRPQCYYMLINLHSKWLPLNLWACVKCILHKTSAEAILYAQDVLCKLYMRSRVKKMPLHKDDDLLIYLSWLEVRRLTLLCLFCLLFQSKIKHLAKVILLFLRQSARTATFIL